jgi:hypothetical protein
MGKDWRQAADGVERREGGCLAVETAQDGEEEEEEEMDEAVEREDCELRVEA